MTPPVQANVERFAGLADVYEAYRPQPPSVLIDVLCRQLGADRPGLVVDIGSGTGLSTLIWAGRADAVVGVEPGADMRQEAERKASRLGVQDVLFVHGYSSNTGLADACADIVTISQALHWMEPEATFAEVARILRPGGVFAAYDCDWPPIVGWQAEAADRAFMAHAATVERERGMVQQVQHWNKSEHLERMRTSGRFRYVRELCLHQVEEGNADRLVGVARSQAHIAGLLKRGLTEEEIGLDVLRAEAERILGEEPRPWYWTYRVRLGIR